MKNFMIILSFILLLVGHFHTATAQKKSINYHTFEPKGDLNCSYIKKYNPQKRKQFYPFNVTDTIKFVSFRHHKLNYPIKGDKLITDSIIEQITLSDNDVASLTDILYNNFYKEKPNFGTFSQCFYPRNAIIFLDKEGKLKESILLCFQCDAFKKSSDMVNFGDKCSQKIEKIRKLFVKLGLKFGTDRTIQSYIGEDFENEGIIKPK